eukprot:393673-Pleurochrysis_carterae.AAC.2
MKSLGAPVSRSREPAAAAGPSPRRDARRDGRRAAFIASAAHTCPKQFRLPQTHCLANPS